MKSFGKSTLLTTVVVFCFCTQAKAINLYDIYFCHYSALSNMETELVEELNSARTSLLNQCARRNEMVSIYDALNEHDAGFVGHIGLADQAMMDTQTKIDLLQSMVDLMSTCITNGWSLVPTNYPGAWLLFDQAYGIYDVVKEAIDDEDSGLNSDLSSVNEHLDEAEESLDELLPTV